MIFLSSKTTGQISYDGSQLVAFVSFSGRGSGDRAAMGAGKSCPPLEKFTVKEQRRKIFQILVTDRGWVAVVLQCGVT